MKRLLSLLLVCLLLLGGCDMPERNTQIQTVPVEQTELPAVSPGQTQPVPEETMPEETVVTLPEENVPEETREPEEDAFVRALDYLPGACQELMYATDRNFTGQQIYDFTEAYLRYGTVKKLALVSQELETQGLYLKIWDGFRPVSAQFKLWEICPNSTYVSNPNTGYSSHSRGNTVDLTLVDAQGREIEMPTGFDDFSALADRNYSDCSETAAANARLLEDTMEKYGFSGYFGEWWHFSDTQSYPVEEIFEPAAG
ncbi:MAG: M15 family metallopeptidase [Faecousia sp.]